MKKILLLSLLCIGFLITPKSYALEPLKVNFGYIPMMYSAPFFVMVEKGWDKENGFEVNPIRFTGAAFMQALASGELDGSLAAVAQPLILKEKGKIVKIVATMTNGLNDVVAVDALAQDLENQSFADALNNFESKHGRKPKMSTIARGAQIDVMVRDWMKENGIDATKIEFIDMHFDQIQQGLLTGTIDAATVPIPVPTLIMSKKEHAKIALAPQDLLPNHPGLLMAFRQEFIDEHPDVVQKFVSLNHKAISYIKDNPDETARIVQKYFAKGLVEDEVLLKAMPRMLPFYDDDIVKMMGSADKIKEMMVEQNILKSAIDINDVIDTRFYKNIQTGEK